MKKKELMLDLFFMACFFAGLYIILVWRGAL